MLIYIVETLIVWRMSIWGYDEVGSKNHRASLFLSSWKYFEAWLRQTPCPSSYLKLCVSISVYREIIPWSENVLCEDHTKWGLCDHTKRHLTKCIGSFQCKDSLPCPFASVAVWSLPVCIGCVRPSIILCSSHIQDLWLLWPLAVIWGSCSSWVDRLAGMLSPGPCKRLLPGLHSRLCYSVLWRCAILGSSHSPFKRDFVIF